MSVSKTTFSNLSKKFLGDTFKDFKKTIEIVELVETPDNQGGFTVEPIVFATPESFIFPMTGKEKKESGRLATAQMFNFMFIPVAGLTAKMKIVYKAEDYQIRSQSDIVEAGVWLIVSAEKGVAQ